MPSRSRIEALAEFLLVFVGALGVVGAIQDYYFLSRSAAVTLEVVSLKYWVALIAATLHLVGPRARRNTSEGGA
jgi:hypothetical protein